MLVVMTTAPDSKLADKIAKTLVEKHLAACVSIIKLEKSVYRWKSEIKEDKEYLLIIKTTDREFDLVEAKIKKLSPYHIPEVISFKTCRENQIYAEWVNRCCTGVI